MRTKVFTFLYYIGVGTLLKYINHRQAKVPVLVFHRVSNTFDPYTEPLSTVDFEKVIVFLKRRYRMGVLSDLFTKEVEELKNTCFITFDDAMVDFYLNALPVLERHQVPVTLFVPTEAVLKGQQLWNHRFFSMFLFAKNKQVKIRLNGELFEVSLKNGWAYDKVMFLHNHLLNQSKSVRDEILDELYLQLSPNPDYSRFASVMKPEYFKNTSYLLNFGSHTASHSYLPTLDEGELTSELCRSKNDLEALLGANIDAVAYPNGGLLDEQLRLVGNYYNFGFKVGDDLVEIRMIHDKGYRLKIPRFNVNDKSAYELFLRINGFHGLIKKNHLLSRLFK